MSAVLSCRVTQLLYITAPHLNFAQVVSDLHAALAVSDFAVPILTWDCDDIALIDFDAERVVVGFTENLPGPHAACLTVAVGNLLQADAADLPDADQLTLCQAVAERLDRRYPSDAQKSQMIEQPLSADLIDRVVDALFLEQNVPLEDDADCDAADLSASIVSSRQGDVERLMSRLSSELVSRAPSLITRAIASATPNARAAGENLSHSANGVAAPHGGITTGGRAKPSFPGHLFWSKAARQTTLKSGVSKGATAPRKNWGNTAELKAVRDALYAADHANIASAPKRLADRVSAQTARAFQSFASLPGDLAKSVSDLRHSHLMGDRIHH